MRTTSVFRSGNSQAVRIPKDLAFDTDRVEIERRGDEVILRPWPRAMDDYLSAIGRCPDFPFVEDEGVIEAPEETW